MRIKNAKPNSVKRGFRVAKEKPVVERGLVDRISEAYRWFNLSMFVHNNIDSFKSLLEQLFQ